MGANAGASLTSGKNNTIIGSYTAEGEENLQSSVVLSNGDGAFVCRWDESATAHQPTVASPIRLCPHR